MIFCCISIKYIFIIQYLRYYYLKIKYIINISSLFFPSGFYFLFKDISDKNIMTFATPQGTIMTLFQMTLGEFKVWSDISLFYKLSLIL